ncbi:hypothetical protein [Corynebacterium sp. A21]|uniref:hypothetical protein n=1 Tax=Corynebacterium sp. A21 TaxID=3457318 RepID=UPI003FD4B247
MQSTSVIPIKEPVVPPAPSTPAPNSAVPAVIPAPTAVLGNYCQPYGGTGTAADGSTLYCANLNLTDALFWHTSPGIVPNPEIEAQMAEQMALTVQPGQLCYDETSTITIVDGTPLYCNPTVNGRNAGNLVWQLTP